MKVLLLYPEFPDTFWSFKHALQFIHKKASMPPLGLLNGCRGDVAIRLGIAPHRSERGQADRRESGMGRLRHDQRDGCAAEPARRVIVRCKQAGLHRSWLAGHFSPSSTSRFRRSITSC